MPVWDFAQLADIRSFFKGKRYPKLLKRLKSLQSFKLLNFFKAGMTVLRAGLWMAQACAPHVIL
jgi:hypothetical protein